MTATLPQPAIRAPRLTGGPWLNGEPLAGWQGRVTLVEFWTYSCVNCLRTLPALKAWHERYAAHGLAVIGIHTPEFPFEHDPENVARAVRDLGVTYPVVLDNDRANWSAFANRFWPHRYLIDPTGRIRHDYAGEGGEAGTETAIRALLLAHSAGTLPPPVYTPDSEEWPEAAMGAVCVPATPELFAGYYRGVSGNPSGFAEDRAADYADPGEYREGYIHLDGYWHVGAESARFVGPGTGTLRVAFRGLSPNVVLAPPADGTARVEALVVPLVLSDSHAQPEVLTVDSPRLYALSGAAEAVPGDMLHLTLTTATSGLEIFSFTFESCLHDCGQNTVTCDDSGAAS